MHTVLVALKEPLLRTGVRVTLQGSPDFRVAGEADRAAAVLPSVADLRPDILLLDARFQFEDEDLLERLNREHPRCRVLVMVDHADEECTVRALLQGPRERWLADDVLKRLKECCLLALRASARGCLPKDAPPERLLTALRAIGQGEIWTGPGLAAYWFESLREDGRERAEGLTARELEVIALVAEGLTNREIACRLHLGEQTVKNHIARIMEKVGVRNRVELAIYAVRGRLV